MRATLVFLACVIATAIASPFELTDEYMKKYQDGMDELIKAAGEYTPKEFSFEHLLKDKEIIKNPHEYDFIIVGGGTSGAVLASRLSEIPEYNVLLIEAGLAETPVTKIPSLHPFASKVYQWGFKTVPQNNWCYNYPNHQCPIPSAKILGGTTSINEMVYNRGNKRDFDTWADEENKQWCYDDVLPYFKKSEDAHLHHFDRKFHSQGGLQSVEDNDLDHTNNLTKRWLEAGAHFSLPTVDYNGKEQLGLSAVQLMTMRGERRSTFASFIEKFRRKNLFVLRNNVVIDILISPHTKDAQGVKYIDPLGNVKVVKATKEVILSAGPINSAKLLMLSGVGPKEVLTEAGVECLVDSPVGKHLKDHPTVDLHFVKDKEHTVDHEAHHEHEHKDKDKEHVPDHDHEHKHDTKEKVKPKKEDPEHDALLEYLKNSHGPMTQPQVKAMAQMKVPSSKIASKHPDIQLTLRQPTVHHHHLDDKDHMTISISLNHPLSHGVIKIANNDSLKFPLIDMNFYSDIDEEDLRMMKEGIKSARVLASGMHLKEVEDKVCSDDKVKGEIEDRDECLVKHRTRSAGDLTGTTIMGKDPEKSVVDNELQVHGVHKLRVVDLAVVPVSITGDVRATGLMIAEKAGDLIKQAWK